MRKNLNSNCDKIQNLKFGQDWKTKILIKLKLGQDKKIQLWLNKIIKMWGNSNCENPKTEIVTKPKNSNGYKT